MKYSTQIKFFDIGEIYRKRILTNIYVNFNINLTIQNLSKKASHFLGTTLNSSTPFARTS